MTRRAFVLGWPIEHSKSPVMFRAACDALGLDAVMEPLAVPPEQLATEVARLRALPMLGASVTVPHKLEVAKLCDELTATAREIGAVNCLELAGARLVGHNTDAPGFADALAAAGYHGTRAVILGAGGAARAVAHALPGATIFARRGGRPWRELDFSGADLIADCTSAGLDPVTDVPFTDGLPLATLAPGALVATLVYHRRTALLERAAARGHATLDGRAMLVHQAARAIAIWTGRAAPVDIMTRALDDALVKSA